MARKAKIIVHTGREEPEPPAIAHLLLLLSGVCALLLPTIPGLDYSVPRTLLLAASLCVFLWTVARIGWRWAVFCSMLCAVFWCVACILLQEELSVQLTGAARLLLSRTDAESVPFGLAASLYAVLVVLLFFSSELLIGSHVLPYSLTMLFFLLGPLLGVHPSIEAAALALIFQFCYWAMNGSGMRQSRFDFALPSRTRLTALTGAAMSLILAAVLLIAVPLAARNDERLYAPAYVAEGAIRRGVSRLSGAASALVTGGNLNRGNQYPTGTPHLVLTASRKPTQPVYLRGFSGGDYQYGGWEWNVETETRIFQDMASEWRAGWDISSGERDFLVGTIYRNFNEMYWRLNDASRAFRGDASPADISMSVQRNDEQYLNAYTPYYGVWRGGKVGIASSFDPPIVNFYEQGDIAIDWDNAPDADNCKWIEKHYQQHIQSAYTRVPSERLPRLVKLCREHPLTDPDEITAFILHTLQSRASYSLTPGWTPFNRDMVEYFLFENGLGYCQHFASAATLMYRLYGIPARYATGYIATPEDFVSVRAALDSHYPPSEESQSPEGEHIAVLTDISAHAWVEIFLSGYGWTPVEVTPAADGSITPQYPGLNLEKLAERLAEWNLVFPATGGQRAPAYSAQSLVASFATGMSRRTRETVAHWLDAALLCTPFLIAAAFYYRRRRRLAMYAVADCRVSYGRLLSMLRFSGVMPDCDGQEADFPERLSAAIPAIAEPDAVRLYRTAQAAAYGPDSVPEAEHAFARNLCQRVAESLYDRLNVWKRFLFRWWHLYG